MRITAKYVVDGFLLLFLAFALICAAVVGRRMWSAAQPPPVAETILGETVPFQSQTSVGLSGARVGVIEFSDFNCPFCARFAVETHPYLVRTYIETGKVMWMFNNMPLESLHPGAIRVASAAQCAAAEGRFWQYYEALFADPAARAEADLRRIARTLYVQRDPMECVGAEVLGTIRGEAELAARHGLEGTPSFLLGKLDKDLNLLITRKIVGFRSADDFAGVLEALLR